ncbi:hypothetical protein HU200_050736 [Digitaria exilis]|uniref:Uncharacterized protein n=1 Tax=Digitaria exilis TaxID=1010633 RepID=A0A835AR20_9POAL|nr:hypothetical protein HU200_050736 [Digitaria exilis]
MLCQQCEKPLDLLWFWTKRDRGVKDHGVFVRGGISYAITDNLQVVPADTDSLMYLLHDMGIEDVTMLEEKAVELGLEEGSSSISAIDNLHKSVVKNMSGCFKSDGCRGMVLSPYLPPFFSCGNHVLMIDELPPVKGSVPCCPSCIRNCSSFSLSEMKCSHAKTKVLAVNPKVPTMTTETGGGYAKGPGKFLVTNELIVVPFSLINSLNALKKKEHPVSKLAATEFTFTQVEVIRVTFSATSCLPSKSNSRDIDSL